MSTVELLEKLRSIDVRVWTEGEQLRLNAPQGVLTPDLRAELARRKSEILAFFEGTGATTEIPLKRISHDGELPLSFSQIRLWFLEQFEPGTAAFNMPQLVRLTGSLDAFALHRSLGEVVRRHEVLRTTFAAAEKGPVQVIAPQLELAVPLVDLRHLPATRRSPRALELAAAAAAEPFDITRGPLLRALLMRLAETEHLFLVTLHHIVFDGWSRGIFLQEVKVLYEAFRAGLSSPLPEPAFHYLDFAVWQRRRLRGEALESLVAYWRRQLADASPVLRLPTDRPRPPVRNERGAKLPVRFPAVLSEALKQFCARQGTTPFIVLLAAAKALLHRYTGQHDLSMGTFIANRNRGELENLIGFFVNTLVLRTNLAGNPEFLKLVDRVREVALGAYGHQDLPFEKLLEELQVEREMSVSPLFQVALVFQNTPAPTLELSRLTVEPLEIPGPIWANFDWTLWLWEEGAQLDGYVDYKTDLFDRTTILRLLSHFQTLLGSAVATGQKELSELPLLGPAERHQLLKAWNDTAVVRPEGLLVHRLFEAQVERAPDSVAVVFEEQELTYRELNARANRLARHLRSLGIGPEDLVAILAERSLEMIAAVLGVLKAGGTYLPLDVTHTRERLGYLLEVARPGVLLTTERLAEGLPEARCEVLPVDRVLTDEGLSAANPVAQGSPENLAYVIYTSGSTGRPKGVMVTHASLVNAYLAWEESYGLRDGASCHLQMASFSFDVFAGDLVRALCSGGRLVLCPRETLLEAAELYQLMRRRGIDSAEFVPAVARPLMQYLKETGQTLDFMRLLVVGSDVWYVRELRELCGLAGAGTRTINSYGLSEVTIDSSYLEGDVEGLHADAQVPIGRPFGGTRLYLLDPNLGSVAVGVPAELCLGGLGLARGYFRQPALTAATFVPDPRSGEPGARLYKTGDQARYLVDGDVELLGRVDAQVKIRGFRIEPAEVEAVLGEHPELDEAAVVARDDLPGDVCLVAYVVPHAGTAPGRDTLRRFLKERVSDYMVPSVFVTLDALPLSSNGKVDRRRLPVPEIHSAAAEPRSPSTLVEEALVEIFQEVTGAPRVGVDDNFFELGGHSLLATQVVSRVREAFAIELPLRTLFELPVLAELALAVEEQLIAPAEAPSHIPRRTVGMAPELSFAQQRLWLLDQLEPATAVYNLPAAVSLEGSLDADALEHSLEGIVRRHETLRTTFASDGGRPVQVIAAAQAVALPRLDLRGLPAPRRRAEVRRLTGEEARRPFDLSRGPLLRATLLQLTPEEHTLLVTMHHICSDAWSMGLFVRELVALYKAHVSGSRALLPELGIQYADFAHWQRQELQGERLEKLLAYWRRELDGAPSFLDLPVDRQRSALPGASGATRYFVYPRSLADAVEALGQRHASTPFMVLIAAFMLLLHRYTGQPDILLGSPIANRNRSETEGLIGFFVNTLVLRSDLTEMEEDPPFPEHLARVRERSLEAYAHQDLPFEKLVEEIQPERSRNRTPLFQVMLAHENAPVEILDTQDLGLGELTLRSVETDSGAAKFDLTLLLRREPRGLAGALEYANGLFDETTIDRLVHHYRALVESILTRPEGRTSSLELLTPAERWQMTGEWNAAQAPPAAPVTGLQQTFEAQARKAPDAVALVFEGGGGERRWSYSELDRHADQLAHRLRELGVGPEVLVGVATERTPEMVAGILAVWKAGGAYVPLDPAYPGERLAFMLKDAGAEVLLTQEHLESSAAGARHVLFLDTFWEKGLGQPSERPVPTSGADNLAYVIYTSGSTGRPKGVAITHRSALALLDWSRQAFSGERLQGVLASTSICFDLSIFELFAPLSAGGQVILARNALALPQLAARDEVTLINTVPSAMTELLRIKGVASSVVTVNLAGEPLPGRLVRQIYEQSAVKEVWNLYGPSEDTTYSTWCRMERDLDGKPSIGRPLPGTQAYVVDRDLRGVPYGVAGELYLGGAGLVRGYLARPALTAERFVPDPWSARRLPPAAGARLYRTGDLARYLPDGHLDLLGRMDYQVKIRGFRIELGEIEAALTSHETVAEAVVVVRPTGEDGDQRLVAYAVAAHDGKKAPTVESLRSSLATKLPGYMMPSAFVVLEALPLTPNGKIDRQALPAPGEPDSAASAAAPPRTELERILAEIWCRLLGREKVGVHQSFFDLGGHSLLVTQVTSQLGKALGRRISPVEMFEHPTIASLARAIDPRPAAMAEARRPRRRAGAGTGDIAIIGMAGRFPGARNLEELWSNLAAGREAVTFFTPEELAAQGVPAETLADPSYVPARALLDEVELFDAGFFGFSPREAQLMDPQQRFFLEVAWEALEAAGVDPTRFPGEIAVYAGASLSTYFLRNLFSHPALLETGTDMEVLLANDKDYLATLLSYRFDLRGPAMSLGTACSTSLVAVHQACRSLLNGECDAALAGGSSMSFPQRAGYFYRQGGILSPDGHCRSFDARASGTLKGDGVGVVVLKRLPDALEARDPIHAVIKGTALNNDGSGKIGFTAPSVEGQAAVIAEAQQQAGVSPETITYVEAHGTATPLGDPVEIRALTRAFRAGTGENGFCALGSVKSNLGHLDAAAGVTGLIKTVLALEHRQIPPSLHFETPNPEIDFASSPFFVNTELRPWDTDQLPRRAGVSSFGLGGTNAHAVLEEAPDVSPPALASPPYLLVLSARTPAALEATTDRLAAHLAARPEEDLADVSWTLLEGRRRFEARRILVAEDSLDAARALTERDSARLQGSFRQPRSRAVTFLFPGQGAQQPGMGAELYAKESLFRQTLDRSCELLEQPLGLDLKEVLFPAAARAAPAATRLRETALAQPALFVLEHALARLWMSWGVEPQAMLGHSIGEYVAACLGGVFSLEDVLPLVAARGRLMGAMPAGAMLAVPRPESEMAAWLGEDLELAAVNAPRRCVATGPVAAIEELEKRLASANVPSRRLHTSHAFHSAMMEDALGPFREEVRRVSLTPPRIAFVSNVTGSWITAGEATDPEYWVRHLRATVRFADGVGLLLDEPDRALVEVGPGNVLTTLAREQAGEDAGLLLASLPHAGDRRPARAFLLTAAGRLWLAGVEISGAGLFADGRRRLALPTYPFEHQRYWIEPGLRPETAQAEPGDAALRKKTQLDEWFYLPAWRATPALPPLAPGKLAEEERTWLVFVEDGPLGGAVVERLKAERQRVATVTAGSRYARLADDAWAIDPRLAADYQRLLAELGAPPSFVLHLWTVGEMPAEAVDARMFEQARVLGYSSLLFLAQALAAAPSADPLQLVVVSSQLYDVSGLEATCPEKATLLGPLLVIPQEHPSIACLSVDVVPAAADSTELAERILCEAVTPSSDVAVACRGFRRWVRAFDKIELKASTASVPVLRDRGVYLITGGLGNVGLLLAEHLAKTVKARLVLLGRSGLPPGAQQDAWLRAHGDEDPQSRRITRVRALESMGAEVLVVRADVADRTRMRSVLRSIDERFGELHGVIHAAGITRNFQPLTRIGDEESQAQFRSKVHGLYVLEEALAERPCDFRLLISSNASVLGGLGFIAYAAANAFMDAFAAARGRDGRRRWISSNWDGWPAEKPAKSAPATAAQELSMTVEESLQAFDRVLLGASFPQVIVATGDLEARLAVWVRRRWEEPEVAEALYQRPELESRYAAPRNEIEEKLTEIWQSVLAISPIGIHDNFFDLGGHSLMAIQIASRVAETCGVELEVRSLFETPTVAGLAEHVGAARSKLGPADTGPAADLGSTPPLVAVSRDQELPLSFAQQRLWFLAQLEPENPEYNLPAAIAIGGPLDVAVLSRCLDEVVRRHETLRTHFAESEDGPVQLIDPPRSQALPVVDLAGLAAGRHQAEIRRLAAADAVRPFDLARGPLLRTLLVALGDEHVFLLNQHHIVSDGWSIGVLVREVAALYHAFARGEASPLGVLPVQYADFAVWQRQWLDGETLQRQVDYWRRKLAGVEVLELPTDRPRPAVSSSRGAQRPLTFPRPLVEALEALSQAHGTTLFMTLLAAFKVLLHRYTAQRDIAVGSPIAGRRHREIEGLVGFFVNTLVLRSDLAGTFVELLEQVRETALEAYAHQDLPFEQLVKELNPERDRSRTPLFQVVLVLQNAPLETLEIEGLTLRPLLTDSGTAKFDLTLDLASQPEGLVGSVEHATDLFDTVTIVRLGRHLETLMEAIVAQPQEKIAELELLRTAERQQLLEEWTGTATAYPRDTTVHDLFSAWSARSPEAVALAWEGDDGDVREMSYGELERRSNQLGSYLRRRGVRPEVPVGLCVERSPEMVVAILAVLKAGGAYVPLDPADPEARLAFLVADSRVSMVITQAHLAGRIPEAVSALCLDAGWEAIAGEDDERLLSPVTAENLCYVMYTSGTTGTPKGSAVAHRAVVRLVRETDYADFGPEEVFLQLAPISFDASTLEIWGPLLNGGRLVLYPPRSLSLAELAAQLGRHAVTTLWLTAGLFHQMVESHAESLAPLRQLLAGGDVLSPPHVRAVLEKLDGWLVNGYGPTENTTFTCCHRMRGGAGTVASVPVGRPVANTRIYLVDRDLAPVPVGVPGALLAGGDGLSRGYHARPSLTAESFIPDPFSTGSPPRAAGGRLYKTGDLARYLPDGTVEFLGRLDMQVKIRGFRIEPGEIETMLQAHEAITEAVVVAREDVEGDRRLVAYVVARAEPPATAQLRSFLAKKLPPYMVPSALVVLEELPLSANGKVDRRALPAPDARPAEEAYVAPRTPTEEALAGIWSEILGVGRVGVLDDFFELGGHSLLATRLVSRMNKAFRAELPISSLFDATTVAKMGQVLIENEPRPGQTEKVARLLLKVRKLSAEDLRETLARKREEISSHG